MAIDYGSVFRPRFASLTLLYKAKFVLISMCFALIRQTVAIKRCNFRLTRLEKSLILIALLSFKIYRNLHDP